MSEPRPIGSTPTQPIDYIQDLKGPEYKAFNKFVEDLFVSDIAGIATKPAMLRSCPWASRPRSWQAIVVDGVIDTLEETDIFGLFLDIVSQNMNALSNSGLSAEEIRSGLEVYQEIYRDYATLKLNGDREKDIFLPVDKANQLLTCVQALKKICSQPWEKDALCFIEKEICAMDSERGLRFLAHVENLYDDLKYDDGFKNFLSSRNISLDDMNQMSGVPIDYVESQNPNAPTLVVYMDEHQSVKAQANQIHDVSVWDKYNPLYCLEGETLSSLELTRGLTISTLTLGLRVTSLGLDSDISDLRRSENLSDADRVKLSNLEKQKNEVDTMHSTLSAVKVSKDGSISQEKLATILALDQSKLLSYLPDDVRSDVFPLYLKKAVGIDVEVEEGGETGFDLVLDIENQKAVGNATSEFLTNVWTLQYRSKVFLDHSMEALKNNETTLGILRAGVDHYYSIKSYAQERADVNVIFMRV